MHMMKQTVDNERYTSFSEKESTLFNSKRILIIGGGVGGCCTALKLAELGYSVVVFEKNKLFSGSSSRTPGRMGLGFHYVNQETSIMYLKSTINFVKAFPGFRIGEELPWAHPLRHGRYFITKDSLFSPEHILTTYAAIQSEYANLIQKDKSNEVFGPADQLYRVLEPSAYCNEVNGDHVALGIETAEHLLNWPKFSTHLVKRMLAHKNITIYEDTEVINIVKNSDKNRRYTFVTETTHKTNKPMKRIFSGNFVVNATWEHLDKINSLAAISMPQELRTNRVKILCEVILPESLKNSPSMFFCMGPYCMFSNMGDGRGMMTFAPKTNLEYATDVDVSDYAKRLLAGNATWEEKNNFAQEIIAGVAQYIPAMHQAKFSDVKFGVVKTIGEVDIFNCDSQFHRRDYDGIREDEAGWISNPCMKLLYCLENANTIVQLIENHFKTKVSS